MHWGLALRAKVFGGFHDPVSEIHLPIAIDGDSRGEGVRRIAQPAGQTEAVLRSARWQRRKAGRNPRLDLLAQITVVAPPQDMRLPRLLHLLHHH